MCFLQQSTYINEGNDEMVFKGIIMKERSTKKRVLMFFGCLFIAALEFWQHNYVFAIVALILAFFCIAFKKEHVISEEGVDIRYILLGIPYNYRWTWDQITAIRPDYKKARPKVLLEIAKDVSIRPFVFTLEDAVKVMEFAKQMNPDAYIDDRTEEEREEYKQERDRMIAEKQMQIRRQKQEAKAKKRKKN